MVGGQARAVSIGALVAVLPAVLMPLASAPSPAAALTCEASLDAASDGALVELQDLLDRPSIVGDPAAACSTWTLRLSGTFLLDTTLTYLGTAALHLAGPEPSDAAGAAVLVGEGRRILRLLAPASRLELTDLVLRGGAARGADLDGAGGAVAIEEQPDIVSELRATRVAFRDNDAARGGAIAVDRAILVDVEVEGSTADAGGGLDVFELTATRTTFVGNRATGTPGTGGAVRASGDVTLENATFSANAAQAGASVWLAGAASPTLHATFVTFASARSAEAGAHLHADVAGGGRVLLVLRGSVLTGATWLDPDGPHGTPTPASCAGFSAPADTDPAPPSSADSFASDATCGPGVSVLDASPELTALGVAGSRAGVGEAARVHVPAIAGPLVDAVGCDGTWPSSDQLGRSRPVPTGGRCDAGSVELTATGPAPGGGGDDAGPDDPTTQDPTVQAPPRPSRIRAGEGTMPRRPLLSVRR